MKINRRHFLRASGYAVGGISLSSPSAKALLSQLEPRNGSGKRIAILGAGMAGLTAGWERKNAGYDVTILEAQLHPGGRVHTIREGSPTTFTPRLVRDAFRKVTLSHWDGLSASDSNWSHSVLPVWRKWLSSKENG